MPYKNKSDAIKNSKKYYRKNKKEVLERNKNWVSKNREKWNQYTLKWNKKNRGIYNKNSKKRWKADKAYRLGRLLSHRLWWALRKSKSKKLYSTELLLGCSIEFAKGYLEAQFTDGMTWENIHVDHVRPCASFNLKDEEQQRKCFHYTNLKPMLKIENIRKGSSWNGKKHFYEAVI